MYSVKFCGVDRLLLKQDFYDLFVKLALIISGVLVNVRSVFKFLVVLMSSMSNRPHTLSCCLQLLLGYLPPARDLWQKVLSENRLKYSKLKDEYLLSPVRPKF